MVVWVTPFIKRTVWSLIIIHEYDYQLSNFFSIKERLVITSNKFFLVISVIYFLQKNYNVILTREQNDSMNQHLFSFCQSPTIQFLPLNNTIFSLPVVLCSSLWKCPIWSFCWLIHFYVHSNNRFAS